MTCGAISKGPVKLILTITRDLTGHALRPGLLLIEADPSHLGGDEGGMGNDRVIDLGFHEAR